MFENLPLRSNQGHYSLQDISENAGYLKMQQRHEVPSNADNDFCLDGTSKFLIARPTTEEAQQNLLYPQSFSYIMANASYFTTRQNYPSYLLSFTYAGQGILRYQGQEYQLKAGDGFLIDCRIPHSYRTAKDYWEHSGLHFNGGPTDYLVKVCFGDAPPLFHYKRIEKYQSQLEQLLQTMLSASTLRQLEFSVQLQQILMDTANHNQQELLKPTIPEFIVELQTYLNDHFAENISVDEMARISCVSKYYLIHQFKKFTGFTPKDYTRRLRIEQAKALLDSTDTPGYKIGQLVGFPNETSFITYFKRTTGLTPYEYRRMCR